MNCRDWMDEIVEKARQGREPGPALREHLGNCPECRGLSDAEQRLSGPMRELRATLRSERSPEWRRADLLNRFDRAQKAAVRPRWVLAAAASVVMILSAGLLWRSSTPPVDPAAVTVSTQSAPDTSEFVDIPYAPPLAAGEMVRVVRTELQASALDRMGFTMPGLSGDSFDAEVVLGQDGLPRAVRVLAEEGTEN